MKIIALTLLFAGFSVFASPTPTFWSDSYDAGDGICRCDSSYDHGINTTMVNTPCGQKSVPEVCALITEKYGVGPVGNRTYYNTVQCGHQPYNNVVDETLCPGIPQNTSNWTGPRCQETGSQWPLQGICESNLNCGNSSWGGSGSALQFSCATSSSPENQVGLDKLLLLVGIAVLSIFMFPPDLNHRGGEIRTRNRY